MTFRGSLRVFGGADVKKHHFYVFLYFTAELTEVRMLKVDLVVPYETTCWILLHLCNKLCISGASPKNSSVHSCCYSCHPISAVLMLQRTPSCQISWNHKMFWVEGISSLGANICCLGSRWIIHICRLKTHLVFLLSWGEHLQKKTNLELSQWLGWPQHNHQNEV